MKSTWEGVRAGSGGNIMDNRIFIFPHFPSRFRQVAGFAQLAGACIFPPLLAVRITGSRFVLMV